jgi:hypothetical protein
LKAVRPFALYPSDAYLWIKERKNMRTAKIYSRLLAIAAAASLTLGLVACGPQEDQTPMQPPQQPDQHRPLTPP